MHGTKYKGLGFLLVSEVDGIFEDTVTTAVEYVKLDIKVAGITEGNTSSEDDETVTVNTPLIGLDTFI